MFVFFFVVVVVVVGCRRRRRSLLYSCSVIDVYCDQKTTSRWPPPPSSLFLFLAILCVYVCACFKSWELVKEEEDEVGTWKTFTILFCSWTHNGALRATAASVCDAIPLGACHVHDPDWQRVICLPDMKTFFFFTCQFLCSSLCISVAWATHALSVLLYLSRASTIFLSLLFHLDLYLFVRATVCLCVSPRQAALTSISAQFFLFFSSPFVLLRCWVCCGVLFFSPLPPTAGYCRAHPAARRNVGAILPSFYFLSQPVTHTNLKKSKPMFFRTVFFFFFFLSVYCIFKGWKTVVNVYLYSLSRYSLLYVYV